MFPFRRRVLKQTVVVNLKTNKAFKGVAWAKSGPLLVLREVELLEGGRPPMAVDGEVLVERSNVDFIQVLMRVQE